MTSHRMLSIYECHWHRTDMTLCHLGDHVRLCIAPENEEKHKHDKTKINIFSALSFICRTTCFKCCSTVRPGWVIFKSKPLKADWIRRLDSLYSLVGRQLWGHQAKWVWTWTYHIFSFLLVVILHSKSYILQKTPLKLDKLWPIERLSNNRKQEGFISFVWFYLQINICKFRLILLDPITINIVIANQRPQAGSNPGLLVNCFTDCHSCCIWWQIFKYLLHQLCLNFSYTKFCQILSIHDFLVISLRCRTDYVDVRYINWVYHNGRKQ